MEWNGDVRFYIKNFLFLLLDEVPDGSEDIFDFSPTLPDLVSYSTTSFGNYCTKGCSWFPSGNKILVPCEDARLVNYFRFNFNFLNI